MLRFIRSANLGYIADDTLMVVIAVVALGSRFAPGGCSMIVQPLMHTSGSTRATRRARPAASATSTTALTSL